MTRYRINELNVTSEITTDDGNSLEAHIGLAIRQAIAKRVQAAADVATIIPDANNADLVTVAELSQTTTFANPVGAPADGQILELRIKSTAVRTLAHGSAYRASTDVALLTATAGSSKTQRETFEWNAAASKWDLLSTNVGH